MSLLRRFAIYLSVACGVTAILTTGAWLVVNDHSFVANQAQAVIGF